MSEQMTTLSPIDRKRLYDRVQQIEMEEIPVVFLVCPDLLVGAKDRLKNFKPAVLDSHTLWNSEQLFVQDKKTVSR
jgi:ABC-type transport system substrate-binding protein